MLLFTLQSKYLGGMMRRISYVFIGALCIAHVQAASFDCTKAGTKIEKMICANELISKLDEEMNAVYQHAHDLKYSQENIFESQKRWLKIRNRCGDIQCLEASYRERLAEMSEHYKLMMSKNVKLCNAMLALYNEDMKKVGRIKYRDHEMFLGIEWQSNSDDMHLLYSTFDINNDGSKELVYRTTMGFHGINTDRYFIFPEHSDISSKLTAGVGGWKALNETQDRIEGNKGYELNDRESSIHTSLSPYVVLKPFVVDGITYISMTDARPRWIVIAKYLNTNNLLDVCYFYDANIPAFDHDRDVLGY